MWQPRFSFPVFLVFFTFFFGNTFAQQINNPLLATDYQLQREWVDSIYNQMTLEEKVGQLFMVAAYSNQSKALTDKVKELIATHHVGGVIFSKGGPLRQAKLNNEFQEVSKIPLLVGMDAEWGLAMRLDSTFAFPWNMTLGAIRDPKLVEEAGAAIAKHSKRLGVHLNFAPVVDINTNPENPIIGNRSFGEDKENVTTKALAFMKGMQRENVLSSAKHFPGHGDTDSDSHKTLPTVGFSKGRLDSIELYPYRRLIEEGLSSVMVGHLNVPGLEQNQNLPSSISRTIVTDLLKNELDFHGLIITDALNMKGASNHSAPGEIDLAAFLAGNDILLISEDVPKASQRLIDAYNAGLITEERLKHSVRKILFAKYKVGLNHYKPVRESYLYGELNSITNNVLEHKLMENALTVIKNDRAVIPIKDLEKRKIAYVHFGDDDGTPFFDQLNRYGKVDRVEADQLGDLLEELENYNLVVLGYHKSNASPWSSYKFTNKELVWLYEIARKNRVILNVFTRPYALLDLETNRNFEGILMAYQNSPVAQEKAAQLVFGAIEAKGRLPVSAGKEFPEGTGFRTKNLNRLAYGLPESVGMNSYKLSRIDSLITAAIEKKMSPGMQVLVARKGKVIYERNAGYHTYEKEKPVSANDVYDIASLTKILGTLPLVMELVDQDELDLNTLLSDMLPVFRNSNKDKINLQQMLSHYARLKPWIPFHRQTFDPATKGPSFVYYRNEEEPGFNTRVAEGLYIRNDLRDSIIQVIQESDLQSKLEYRYSDLPYYLLKDFLENIYGTSLDYLTKDHFYNSLGANYTTYLPLNHFPKEQIVPTEDDKLWRKQLLQGYVHDEGAALLGGIGGHAGLFSNANDVAKIMQMYLNGGSYGGKEYFNKETVDMFNTCYYCDKDVRRGVGFDKPQLEKAGPTCGCVSMESFGHSGFTGTLTWADPEEEIVYVFLSNRIHPSAENRKLIREGIRTKIQEVIYEAIDQ